ncbi:hypothetical protein Q4583_01105 [Neptunomonas phycophila]|uniref:hypothetical protein n=1 Tax=Neptunomonas phycophila TaxID=1572645 RepID=UPI0026E404F5|nr:hypothetical protein [Neptunomonas phycophila]MDO6782694.1 hypothetical protein [Neptunomonas phycophila]
MFNKVANKLRKIDYWLYCLKYSRKTEILVLGDSHVSVFKRRYLRGWFPDFFFNVISVGGATISGIENPNSRTKAMPIFEKALAQTKSKTVILCLGEVDTGFVIWLKAQRDLVSVNEALNETVEKYEKFISRLMENFNVICISTPLPTIQDGVAFGDVADARKEVKATLKERTELTLDFNKKIKNYCERKNITNLFLDYEFLDNEKGVVNNRFLHADPRDHHFDDYEYSEVLKVHLQSSLLKKS